VRWSGKPEENDMDRFGSVDEILDFAITREEKATEFYGQLARLAGSTEKQDMFKAFAKEEAAHKAKLQAIKRDKTLLAAAHAVPDLKIGDYLVADEAGPDMDYQHALILAMKREKASFRLYTDMAARTQDAALRSVLLALASEEANHKLKFEIEYDETVLKEG
jgi:rubrerythrin